MRTKEPIGDLANRHDGPAPLATRSPESSTMPAGSDLNLDFHAPVSARLGEAFDLRAAIEMRRVVERISVEIDYDPTLLRVRAPEEIDYSGRPPDDRTFAIDRLYDGRVTVVMAPGAGTRGPEFRMSADLVQFEVLKPGVAVVNITDIRATGPSARSLAWTASGQQTRIALN